MPYFSAGLEPSLPQETDSRMEGLGDRFCVLGGMPDTQVKKTAPEASENYTVIGTTAHKYRPDAACYKQCGFPLKKKDLVRARIS